MLSALRRIARSVKYQNLYTRAKELNHIRLFENDTDFSYLQSLFLYYLELYHSLYTALAQGEPNLSEEVLTDDIRTDAYLLWRNKAKNKKTDIKTTTTSDNSVVFKRR